MCPTEAVHRVLELAIAMPITMAGREEK
jgi:hypothetical protein